MHINGDPQHCNRILHFPTVHLSLTSLVWRLQIWWTYRTVQWLVRRRSSIMFSATEIMWLFAMSDNVERRWTHFALMSPPSPRAALWLRHQCRPVKCTAGAGLTPFRRHRVITLNITCHRRLPPLRARQESPRRAPKTIKAHLNVSSSLLSAPRTSHI